MNNRVACALRVAHPCRVSKSLRGFPRQRRSFSTGGETRKHSVRQHRLVPSSLSCWMVMQTGTSPARGESPGSRPVRRRVPFLAVPSSSNWPSEHRVKACSIEPYRWPMDPPCTSVGQVNTSDQRFRSIGLCEKIVQVTAVKPFGSLWTFHRAGPDKDSELFAKHHFYLATTRNCTPKVSSSSVECVPIGP